MTSVATRVRIFAASFIMLIAFGFLRLLFAIPCLRFLILKLFDVIATVELPHDMYTKTAFSWKMFKAHSTMIRREFQKTAQTGKTAPNLGLVDLNGNERCNLLNIAQEGRPLVVIFCSCTCPVFMKRLPEVFALIDDFSSVADFHFVYVEEAHPSDGWALQGNYDIRQHRDQAERCAAARFFLEQLGRPCELSVAKIDNDASEAYGAPPMRLCIILKDKLEYLGGLGPTFFRPHEVREWFEDFHQKRQEQRCEAERMKE